MLESGEVLHTWVSTWSEVVDKAKYAGLDPDTDVKVAADTVRWLKDNEGWPAGERIRPL